MNVKWALTFGSQLAVGLVLLFYAPETAQGANELGLLLLGSSFGQGLTAQMKATKE